MVSLIKILFENIPFVLTRFLSPGMSALQASRKYGVPSRTLYDKVKKMGILTANIQKQLQQKGKGAGPDTPQKDADPGTLLPINLLGMQLPQVIIFIFFCIFFTVNITILGDMIERLDVTHLL